MGMAMASDGKIAVEFETLRQNYPVYTALPPHLKNFLNALNKGVKPGQPTNTPCCMQVSEALNACGGSHKIAPKSHRRPNSELPAKSGNYYLLAVDELEKHLVATYGPGEEVKVKGRMDKTAIKKYLNGKQGILVFREGVAGKHTELWDRTRILQDGAPSASGARMSEDGIFGTPRVVFWEVTGGAPTTLLVPHWLPGWWEVKDGADVYYYYFFPTGAVCYTKNRPTVQTRPLPTQENSGTFSAEGSRQVTVEWNAAGLPVEVFTPAPTRPPVMAGRFQGYTSPPFTAKKL